MEEIIRQSKVRRRSGDRGKIPRVFRGVDFVSEILIVSVLVISPWAFGTTESWSINLVNSLNYALGLLLLGKHIMRIATGYRTEFWDVRGSLGTRIWILLMGAITFFLLCYIGVSAWNARAVYQVQEQQFVYQEFVSWLPHSYDQAKSWERFFRCLGAACFFWALRDWLLTKTDRDKAGSQVGDRVSERVRRVLWVICINATLIAVEGMMQRLTGTNKLLWLIQPEINAHNSGQFGPFAYRSNAAQLFNMVWPATLGLFLAMNRHHLRGIGRGPETVLVLCFAILVACPFLTSSRLGAVMSCFLILVCLVIIVVRKWLTKRGSSTFWSLLFLVVLVGGIWLNWGDLVKRFTPSTGDETSGRTEIYINAKKIVADYPVFGVGAGAFGAVYQLYREDSTQYWHAYAHDDWLEARATLGRVGFGAVVSLLILAFGHGFMGVGVPLPTDLALYLGVGCMGVLLTALGDLPFQIYSLLIVFLTLLAILSSSVIPRKS